MNTTLPTPAEQEDIEQANLELVVAEAMTPGDLTLEEIITKEGRRQDGEVVVKLSDEQIKAKHDKFHEVYREQVLDNLEFAGLRKDFSLRKKTREADMQQLDNCILRGEETQCVTRWRIPAYKLKGFMPDLDGAEEAFIFDSDFNLIDRVPLTELERQLQIEYEDNDSETVPAEMPEGISEVPQVMTAEPLTNSVTFKDGYATQAYA